jgi:anti-sigma B factor antagonist
MELSYQSRRVGDVSVVRCKGRIVESPESAEFQKHIQDLLPYTRCIVLHVGDVQFVDSSGLGLLVRILIRSRTAGGVIKLCAVPPKLGEVLRITHLEPLFEAYELEEQAIASFYQRPKSADAQFPFLRANVLCVVRSTDVLTYVREVLRHSGYATVTADNLPDAVMLLKATRPSVVITTPDLRSARDTSTAQTFNRLLDAASVIELPADVSTSDAADTARDLLARVRGLLGAPDAPPS